MTVWTDWFASHRSKMGFILHRYHRPGSGGGGTEFTDPWFWSWCFLGLMSITRSHKTAETLFRDSRRAPAGGRHVRDVIIYYISYYIIYNVKYIASFKFKLKYVELKFAGWFQPSDLWPLEPLEKRHFGTWGRIHFSPRHIVDILNIQVTTYHAGII